jgi:ribonucleoside-diphosphate reductase alpha chain
MVDTVNGIVVDFSRDNLFDELGLKRLKESYMREEESSPQERFAYVSKAFGSNQEHSQRLYEYSSKHWLSYSTPILSFGRSKRGLPISCFLPYLHDSAEGLVDCLAEVNWLSMLGGGVGIGD